MDLQLVGAKLNQCWFIVNYNLTNQFQWNSNQNWNISIEENAFENVVWKMVAILSRPQYANICMIQSF